MAGHWTFHRLGITVSSVRRGVRKIEQLEAVLLTIDFDPDNTSCEGHMLLRLESTQVNEDARTAYIHPLHDLVRSGMYEI